MINTISVGELTSKIKLALSGTEFQNIAVQGEVSNFVHHTSGHMYFSLKDDQSRIKAVMFRRYNQQLDFIPKNGETLIALGSIGVYEPNGEYQLYVEFLLPMGVGELHIAFEQLKSKLEAEGLFDSSRKMSLPFLPQRVGVITSPTGAALRDIIQVAKRRNPNIRMLIFPALVQGEGAPQSLINALNQAQATDVDVMIMGRGGGSFEELSAFNDEGVARAIANSKIPIVSAVGHETDFTIADFVADLRAPTPSAAAELVVPQYRDLMQTIAHFQERLEGAILRNLSVQRNSLKGLTERAIFQHPQLLIARRRQGVDELWTSLVQNQNHYLKLRRAELGGLGGKLETLSPLGTLARGYSICHNQQGDLLTRVNQVEDGEIVHVKLHEGELICRVEGGDFLGPEYKERS